MRTPAVVVLASSLSLACSATDKVNVTDPVQVSAVGNPVAVSGIAQPVAVSGIGSPVTVSGAVTVSSPVSVARPELDPDRIEMGTEASGSQFDCIWTAPCSELLAGPFLITDLVTDGGSVFYLSAGPSFVAPRWKIPVGGNVTVTGARFAVRTGEKLYVESIAGHLVWSGFRP